MSEKSRRRRGRPPGTGTKPKDPNRRPIGVYINTRLWRKVRALAIELDMSGGEALDDAMRLWLAKHGRL